MAPKRMEYLELINLVDSIPQDFDYSSFYKLLFPLDPRPHGYISPSTIALVPPFGSSPGIALDHDKRTVTVTTEPTAAAISAAIQPIVDYIVEHDVRGITCGEHSEMFRIVGAAYNGVHVTIERYPLPLLGCVSRGAHMTCFVRDDSASHGIRIWVAKRASNMATYPGKWDTTVAGGVKSDHSPRDCITVEAAEEACIPESEARRRAVSVGTVTYLSGRHDADSGELFRAPATVLHIFDMELRPDEIPRPGDDEVERFELWTVEQVVEAMVAGEFKPNCNLVHLDFFIRHGILTDDNHADYVEIGARLRRRVPLPMNPLPELNERKD